MGLPVPEAGLALLGLTAHEAGLALLGLPAHEAGLALLGLPVHEAGHALLGLLVHEAGLALLGLAVHEATWKVELELPKFRIRAKEIESAQTTHGERVTKQRGAKETEHRRVK